MWGVKHADARPVEGAVAAPRAGERNVVVGHRPIVPEGAVYLLPGHSSRQESC